MNDLVQRLSKGPLPIEASRPDKTALSLKESIDRNYVHILFKNTGTEIGIKLDSANCKFNQEDFALKGGTVHLEGILTLNYDKVRCVADLDLSTLEGVGQLESIDESSYKRILES